MITRDALTMEGERLPARFVPVRIMMVITQRLVGWESLRKYSLVDDYVKR